MLSGEYNFNFELIRIDFKNELQRSNRISQMYKYEIIECGCRKLYSVISISFVDWYELVRTIHEWRHYIFSRKL